MGGEELSNVSDLGDLSDFFALGTKRESSQVLSEAGYEGRMHVRE